MIFNIQNATIHQTTTSTTDSKSKLDLESKINELEARLSKLESFLNGSATIPTPTTTNITITEPTSDIEPETAIDVSNTINTKIEEPTSPITPSNMEIKIEDDKVIETTPTITVPEDDKIFNDDILEEDEYTIPSTVLPLSDSYNAYVEQFKLESNKKATKKAVSIYILNALKEKYVDSNPDIFDGINYNKFNTMSGGVLYNLAEDIHNQIMLIVNNDTKIVEPKTNVEVSNDIDDDNVPVIEDIKSTDDVDSILEELENYDDYDLDDDIKTTDTNIDVTLEELENYDDYNIEDIKVTDTNIDVTLEELEDFDSYDLEPEELEDNTTISDTTDYNAKFEEFKSSLNTDGKCNLSDILYSNIDTYDKLEANFINNKNYFRFGTRWKLDFILSELGISLNNLKKLDDNEAYYKIICTYFAKVQDTNIQGV